MPESPASVEFRPGPFAVPRVLLSRFQRFQIECWSAQAYPIAVCGLLFGHQQGESTHVVAARLSTLDAAAHQAAEDEAHRLGLEVVGMWRSRPDGAPVPMPEDRAVATPSWSHLLVGVDRRAERELRAWRFDGGRFVEEEVSS